MDFGFLAVVTKWARDLGLSPVSTFLITVGVGVLIYLGRITKGIRAGYGVVLQDQKDAAKALRDALALERQNVREMEVQLERERDAKLAALAALTSARQKLVEAGIPIIEVK